MYFHPHSTTRGDFVSQMNTHPITQSYIWTDHTITLTQEIIEKCGLFIVKHKHFNYIIND